MAIYQNMPEAEYRALPGYGSTDLKNALRSYHHMVAEREAFKETPALRLGRAFHCAVLEPERFSTDFIVMPTFSGKGMRERKEHWIMEHADKVWLDFEDMATVLMMEKAVRKHDAAFNLLLDCNQREVSLAWKHFVGDRNVRVDLDLKARLDATDGWCRIVDLKTTLDASPEGFGRQVMNYNYLLQAAHYVAGNSEDFQNSGFVNSYHFIFIAVEKEPPYGVGVYLVEPEQLEIGIKMRDQALRNVAYQSLKPKTTPYSSEVQSLKLPAWAYRTD